MTSADCAGGCMNDLEVKEEEDYLTVSSLYKLGLNVTKLKKKNLKIAKN